MTEAKVVLTAEDNASRVIDQVTRRLGVFNKEGIAMGVTFALVNKAVEIAMSGIQMLTDILKDGIQSSRDLQLNIVYLTNTIDDMDISVKTLKDDLNSLSTAYGVDVNTLATEMRMFTRQGYSASESMRLLGESQRFAKATGEDFAATVEAMNTAMEVFDLDGSDSAYILKKFNEIVDETELSVQDINNMFARASPNIRESGYSLADVVNILYTLEQAGDAPRTMLAEINEVLKNMEGRTIDILPESEVKSIDEKYGAIEKTTTNYWDKYSQRVKQAGRDTVDYFGSVLDFWSDRWLNMYGRKKEPTATPTATPQVDWMDDYIRKTTALDASIKKLNDTISEEETQLSALNQDYHRDRGTYDYMVQMRGATLAVQQQEDAIEKLRRVSNMYSLEQQGNQLEIMKIQYGAMGTRRGLSRGQNKQIEAIEKENALLQIKEAEQQLQIGKIQQNGLQTAQDNLDKIRRQHDQTIYSQELADLNVHIGDVYAAWTKMYTQLAANKAKLLGQQGSYPVAPFVGPPAPSGYSAGIALLNQEFARVASRRLGTPKTR